MTLSRAGRLLCVVAVLAVALLGPQAPAAVRQVGGDDFPLALMAALQLLCLALATWVLLVALAGLARVRVPGVPRALRALLFATAVVTVVSGPAHAEGRHDLTGLPLPDRPASQLRAVAATTSEATPHVRVRAGDTLWSIAADHLPASAPVADVAAASDAWYRANRAVIGADPDLIHPGQSLTPPTEEPS